MIYLAVYDSLNIQQTLLISLVCMLIVFGMLAILWGVVSLFKILPQKQEKVEEQTSNKQIVNKTEKIKMEDIKDDDMMVAAIVASIDYHNEIKKDVRVVSVKEL